MALWTALWLMLPAGVANMAPIFAARLLPHWSRPVDFGRSFRGTRLFGSHKTWRGLFAGVLAGAACFALQALIPPRLAPALALESAPALVGALLGAGALLGDLVKSFFKRRAHVAPGRPWFPWDQVDWLIGSLSMAFLLSAHLSALEAALYLTLGFALTLLVKAAGYVAGLNEDPI
jgi:CDP-2,3-bis-(O-geranylgeranyl)-sn-glycerol synthase